MINNILNNSIDPNHSGSVSASAGSGKTWLLVSRIVRLLLDEIPAQHIVAITFTRKAAGEMRQRLNERLLDMASSNDAELNRLLIGIGLTPQPALLNRARALYDKLLRQTYSVSCTTFHAFCQSLLQAFPLEAGIVPGFTLNEDTLALQNMAMDSFINACSQNDDPASLAMNDLMQHFGSPSLCLKVLRSYFDKRLDWQLYTHQQPDRAEYAISRLRQQFSLQSDSYQYHDFFRSHCISDLKSYFELLALNNTNNDQKLYRVLGKAMEIIQAESTETQFEKAFNKIEAVFFTKSGTPRKRKESKAQAKRLGDSGQARFLELHQNMTALLQQHIDLQRRHRNFHINKAWYQCGQKLLDIYQTLKQDQSVLDFDDLEWHTYQLLYESDAADWVQYRLDARIDHILVDEFQDTNHFQWRLLLSILQEMASGVLQKMRSCFIVGDSKQSIYGFRRAEPALFENASAWLQQSMGAQDIPLSTSWRSSPVIMELVNCVFQDGRLGISDFPTHQTHLQQLPGRVELLPLIEIAQAQPEPTPATGFRHPLLQARIEPDDERYFQEGVRMAALIQRLTRESNGITEQLAYRDIMILVRSRTHLEHYERALLQADIPYSGSGKQSLFEHLEIQDILALLECLVTPYKNLSLAHVLRSPLFSCSEHEMQSLALHSNRNNVWYEVLTQHDWGILEPSLTRAKQCLPRWLDLASRLPTHDALDHIYFESDILNRYHACAPAHLHKRIQQNLLLILNMALELDSGRYPSMEKFLWRLHQIRSANSQEPEEISLSDADQAVQILTIHAAKGLEAKAVILADASYLPKDQSSYQACVKWPVEQARPTHFTLLPSKNERDQISAGLADWNQEKSRKEQANLLYVALTRAKQYLFISAVASAKNMDDSWYAKIKTQCEDYQFGEQNSEGSRVAVFEGTAQSTALDSPAVVLPPIANSKRPLPSYRQTELDTEQDILLPSQMLADQFDSNQCRGQDSSNQDNHAKLRGNYIHQALQSLSNGIDAATLLQQLQSHYTAVPEQEQVAWLNEARENFQAPELAQVFFDSDAIAAHNELPISYFDREQQKFVMGLADRVLIKPKHIHLYDYKSNRIDDLSNVPALLEQYQPQLQAYANGLEKIWPDKTIKRWILFTHIRKLYAI